MFLESWVIIIIILVLVIYWATGTTAGLLGQMGEAPPAGLPESVVGRYAITGTIFAFGVTIVLLAGLSAVYVYYKRPQVPVLDGIEIRVVTAQSNRRDSCMFNWPVGTQVVMSAEGEVGIRKTTESARPSPIESRKAKQSETFRVSGDAWFGDNTCWWLVEDKNGESGWLPEFISRTQVLRQQ